MVNLCLNGEDFHQEYHNVHVKFSFHTILAGHGCSCSWFSIGACAGVDIAVQDGVQE